MKRLRRDKRAVSNAIVVMLSLVLIVIVVGNVVLWSYQMNQLDLERMQEKLSIDNVIGVTRSSWFAAETEYTIAAGTGLSGTYTDTRMIDDYYERFREEKTQIFNPSSYALGGSSKYMSGAVSNLASDDGSYMSIRSYPNYEIRYQESLFTSSTTSTTYQDKVSISVTPQLTADFVLIATAEIQGSSTSNQARAQLTVNTTTFQELRYRVKDATDWYPFCALKRMTLVENTNYVIAIQYCTSNSGATAFVRNAKIAVFSLQSEYAESEALSTTGSTSWEDKVTLVFTPPTDGDYLIIGAANYRGSQANRDTKIRLIQDDTTVHTDNLGRPGSGTINEYYTFGVVRKVALSAASHNFKIQYCISASPAIAGANYAHLVAIRLDQFEGNDYTESEAESSPPASGTWYDKVVNTYAADDRDYLIMGSVSYRAGSTSASVGLDFQTDATSRQSALVEGRDAGNYESAFFLTEQTLAAGSRTDRIRWMGENTNARVRNARLVSCKLPTLMQTVEVEHSGASNTRSWNQLEWTVDLAFTTTYVATTFQLYDYQSGGYPASGDGFMADIINMTDTTRSQTITTNATSFRDAGGNWKVKLRGTKATDTPFELNADWIEIKVTMSDIYRLDISNAFVIDTRTYALSNIEGIEIAARYNVTEAGEKWFIRAYSWTAEGFSDFGFNTTAGSQPVANEWNEYAINLTSSWMDYVGGNGTMLIEFFDEGLSTNQTIVELDFLGVRAVIDGTRFEFKNTGPLTIHIVAVWVLNSTNHQRYDANLFINSGAESTYVRADIRLPSDDFMVKIVTERGNIAVFTNS